MDGAADPPDLGPAEVRAAAEADDVDGVAPHWVAYPSSPDEVAQVVARASSQGWAMIARGAGSMIEWGAPPEHAEVVVDLSKMDAVLEHSTGDFVARVQPGATLAALAATFAPSRQRIPIDEVVAGSTVGGVIATGLAGPSRFRYGSVRDQVIGVQFCRGDGTLVRSGSKVVKNVAGYDLAKLLTGSFGTLGIVTEAILRLRPLAEAARYVTVRLDDAASATGLLRALRELAVTPMAVEVESEPGIPGCAVTVLFEGSPALVDAGTESVGRLAGAVEVAEHPAGEWGRLPGPTTIKMAIEIGAVARAIEVVRELGDAELSPVVRGSAGAGVLYVGIGSEAPPERIAAFVDRVREGAVGLGGTVVALRAPAAVKRAIDLWGPVAGLELMRRVKHAFDPGRVLAPGRFVGGI